MDLHQLKLFVHIYDAGSLSGASERCRIAVSAVSLHLSNLEAELGAVLFSRLPRGVKPTAAGERLITHARGILGAVDAAKADVLNDLMPVSGRVRIGMASSGVTAIGGQLLETMSTRFPLVDVSINDSVASDRLVELLDGEIDIAVAFNPVPHPQLSCDPLLRERLFCIGLRDRLPGDGQPLDLKDVLDLPLILPRQGEGMRALTGDHAWLRKLEARNCLQPGSGLAIREAVFRGLGVTIGSPLLMSNDIRAKDLAIRPIAGPMLWRTLSLCVHRGQVETEAKEACSSIIKALIAEAIVSGAWLGAVSP